MLPQVDVPVALGDLELTMDVVFLVDIALNFRTAVVADAVLIVDKKQIARHYMSKWFPIDLAGSLPWEIVFRIVQAAGHSAGVDIETDLLTLFKVLKVPKLLRLGNFLATTATVSR